MKAIRDHAITLGMLEGGELMAAFSTEMTESIAITKEIAGDRKGSSAKGSISLTISWVCEGPSIELVGEISSKRPKRPRGRSFLFVNDDGSLSTEHPHQSRFDFGQQSRSAAE